MHEHAQEGEVVPAQRGGEECGEVGCGGGGGAAGDEEDLGRGFGGGEELGEREVYLLRVGTAGAIGRCCCGGVRGRGRGRGGGRVSGGMMERSWA